MELKVSGGMAVTELAKKLGSSYMTVKQHCEDLSKRGYLVRIRVPRTEIGRPEIFYRLSDKAEQMFPDIPSSFSIDMLEHARQLFGDTAPEKLLFQYFQDREEYWKTRIKQSATLLNRADAFAKLREKEGLFMKCLHDETAGQVLLREFHHPLHQVFDKFPRAILMEQKAMEVALGARISRVHGELLGGTVPHVDYVLS